MLIKKPIKFLNPPQHHTKTKRPVNNAQLAKDLNIFSHVVHGDNHNGTEPLLFNSINSS